MPSLTVTDTALNELKRVKEEQKLPDDVFVRVSIKGGGCSGFMYDLKFDEPDNFDDKTDKVQLEKDGIKVVVDRRSILFLEGTTVDFFTDLARRGFTFDNPNATKSCGCGSSFQA